MEIECPSQLVFINKVCEECKNGIMQATGKQYKGISGIEYGHKCTNCTNIKYYKKVYPIQSVKMDLKPVYDYIATLTPVAEPVNTSTSLSNQT